MADWLSQHNITTRLKSLRFSMLSTEVMKALETMDGTLCYRCHMYHRICVAPSEIASTRVFTLTKYVILLHCVYHVHHIRSEQAQECEIYICFRTPSPEASLSVFPLQNFFPLAKWNKIFPAPVLTVVNIVKATDSLNY